MHILLLFLLMAGASTAQNFVGSNVCKTCHADVWQNFYKNPHFKSVASGKEPPDRTGCEGCHGPASAHVAAGGGKNTIPRAFSLMTPVRTLDTCLTCHAKYFEKVNTRRSKHTRNVVVSPTSHSIPPSPPPKSLLKKKQNDMSYPCHSTVQAQFSMPFKHRVNE